MSTSLSLFEIVAAVIITAVLCAPQALAQFEPLANLSSL